MPSIKNVGTVEWYGTSCFTVEGQRQQAFLNQMHNIDFAMSEGTSCAPGVIDAIAIAEEAQRSNLLLLTVKIRLLKPIDREEIPYHAQMAGKFACWNHTENTVWDSARSSHPVFAIINELARHTGHPVAASTSIAIGSNIGEDNGRHTLLLTFYSERDIRKPSNYLHALANKMEKWARPKKSVILDEYTREKVERTIADLELTLATAKEFVRMVEVLEFRGDEGSSEIDATLQEMSCLRHVRAPAGPDNDVMRIQTLFQRGQIVLAQTYGRV